VFDWNLSGWLRDPFAADHVTRILPLKSHARLVPANSSILTPANLACVQRWHKPVRQARRHAWIVSRLL
jgi:hypothetical protein